MPYISFKIRSDMFLTSKSSCTFFMLAQILPVFLNISEHQRFYILQMILDIYKDKVSIYFLDKSIYFIYTKNKIKFFDFVKCLVAFNQSHVYKLVTFFEFRLFNLIFSWFSAELRSLTFSYFLSSSHIFFLPNNHIKFFMTYFHVNQCLG